MQDEEEAKQKFKEEAAAAGENEKQVKEIAESMTEDKSVPFVIGASFELGSRSADLPHQASTGSPTTTPLERTR